MPRREQNIYQSARIAAGLTQEAAAEALNLGETTLRGYESGRTVPPDETVLLMIDAYDAEWLRVAHAVATDRLGLLPPDAGPLPMEQSALRMHRQWRELETHVTRFMEIAEDGEADESEAVDLRKVQRAVSRFVSLCLAVQCVDAKKERPDAPTSKRSEFQGKMTKSPETVYKTILPENPQNASTIAGKAVIL